jgi:hypothetical protein
MSNLNKWDHWYVGVKSPEPYGDTQTYSIAAAFLSTCPDVEDWGCGKGFFKTILDPDIEYRGVDGTWSKFADVHADLEEYTSDANGILLRHVLEHNYGWEKILANAVESFAQKLVIILFTPMVDSTTEIAYNVDPGVPDLSFSRHDIEKHLDGLTWTATTISAPDSQYGQETIYLIER